MRLGGKEEGGKGGEGCQFASPERGCPLARIGHGITRVDANYFRPSNRAQYIFNAEYKWLLCSSRREYADSLS